ncbi:unnamed protein product [Penicillium pancosmium]
MSHYLGWKAHHSGDLAITLSKHPLFFATGRAHRLFADGRFNHAVCAIRIRKACALSNTDWMTIPWTHHPKTPKDLLIDIAVELPGLCEGIDDLTLLGNSAAASKLRALLRSRSFEMIAKLAIWEATLSKPTILLDPDEPRPETISSQELANSHLMTFFWGISLNVYGQILPILDGATEASQLNPDACCRNIIRSLPLLLHPSVGTFRQHLVPFPVIACCAYLAACKSPSMQPERKLLVSFFQRREFAAMRPFMSKFSSSNLLSNSLFFSGLHIRLDIQSLIAPVIVPAHPFSTQLTLTRFSSLVAMARRGFSILDPCRISNREPCAKIQSGCGICSKDEPLLRCTRCRVMVYCGREHQVEHFPEHKPACKAIERARASLEEQEQIMRDSSSSDPFIHGSMNEFGPEMRSYILHRCVLVGMIGGINTREAVEKQLEHSMEMLRLCPNDNLGARKTVAPMMIRLNQDRECYAFLKSWVLVSNRSYDNWSNPGLPRFNVESADIFESVDMFLGLNIGISLTVPLFLLKLKTFLDLSLVEAQEGAVRSTGPVRTSREYFNSLQNAVNRSQAFLSTPNFTNPTTRISTFRGFSFK